MTSGPSGHAPKHADGVVETDIPARLDRLPWGRFHTLVVVAASGLLFYRFERGINPKVNEIADALLYCSTCLSVGYADIHPVTRAGKLLGTLLMTYGPGLAAKSLDGPASGQDTQAEILATLRSILARMETESVPKTQAAS